QRALRLPAWARPARARPVQARSARARSAHASKSWGWCSSGNVLTCGGRAAVCSVRCAYDAARVTKVVLLVPRCTDNGTVGRRRLLHPGLSGLMRDDRGQPGSPGPGPVSFARTQRVRLRGEEALRLRDDFKAVAAECLGGTLGRAPGEPSRRV